MKKLLLILLLTPIWCLGKELKISKQIGYNGKELIYKDTSFIINYSNTKITINNIDYLVKRKVESNMQSEMVIDTYFNKQIKLILKIDVMNSAILQVEIWKYPFDYVQIFRL